MSDSDNVVKMPAILERRAKKIEAALVRRENGDKEWIEGTIELATELAAARADHGTDNHKFGEWLDSHFGDNRLPKNERGILIQWGNKPDWTRTILEKTQRSSIQTIHRDEWVVTSPSKSPPPPPPSTPARETAKETIRAYKDTHGVYPTVIQAGKISGKSRIVIEPALAAVVTEDRIAPQELIFKKAQDLQVEARAKVRLYELEKEFEVRVTAENQRQIKILFPDLEKLRNEAKLNERVYREQLEKLAIFTEDEYRNILVCLHPDNSASKERREEAFRVFSVKKLQLTGKK